VGVHSTDWSNGIANKDAQIYGESGVTVNLGEYCGHFTGKFELSFNGDVKTSREVTEEEMTKNNGQSNVDWTEKYQEGIYCTKFTLTHLGDGSTA